MFSDAKQSPSWLYCLLAYKCCGCCFIWLATKSWSREPVQRFQSSIISHSLLASIPCTQHNICGNVILWGIWCSKTSLTLWSIIYPLKSLWSNCTKETSCLNQKKKKLILIFLWFKKNNVWVCDRDCFLSRVQCNICSLRKNSAG